MEGGRETRRGKCEVGGEGDWKAKEKKKGAKSKYWEGLK